MNETQSQPIDDLRFTAPRTCSGVEQIDLERYKPEWKFHISILRLEKGWGEKLWTVMKPEERAIWVVSGEMIRPHRPAVVFATDLPLAKARKTAIRLARTGNA